MHATDKVIFLSGNAVDIDKKISSIIASLWRASICTTNSCEENQLDYSWIEFGCGVDLEKFLNIIMCPKLAPKINWEHIDHSDEFRKKHKLWLFSTHPGRTKNKCLKYFHPSFVDDQITLRPSVRFPITDINCIKKQLGAIRV